VLGITAGILVPRPLKITDVLLDTWVSLLASYARRRRVPIQKGISISPPILCGVQSRQMDTDRAPKWFQAKSGSACIHLRIGFWTFGTSLALIQAWTFRHYVSADAVAYLDMSDGVLLRENWHRLITGVWSPLYPFLLGIARLFLRPSPYEEIPFLHIVNVLSFLFAFVCFEFLVFSLRLHGKETRPGMRDRNFLPTWAHLTMAYIPFLWASFGLISLQSLRPDMLMSGFVYLAAGTLLRMSQRAASWSSNLRLGGVLGLGYLAKAVMLPWGVVVIGCSVLLSKHWRQGISRGAVAFVFLLSVGSLYFIPLSRACGHMTLGESGSYNYLVHVNRAGPGWYLQDVGSGRGKFVRPLRKIFDSPAVYEFSTGEAVTHPLRFDPSYWSEGVRPQFYWRSQCSALRQNIRVYGRILWEAAALILGFVALLILSHPGCDFWKNLLAHWVLWLPALAALGMYAMVHLESRYVGAFLVLLWLGLLTALEWSVKRASYVATWAAIAGAILLFAPLGQRLRYGFTSALHHREYPEAEVAREVQRLGIRTGDQVARISNDVADLGWARMSRVSIIAEVDRNSADAFWTLSVKTQDAVLDALSQTGAKMVIAHVRNEVLPRGWRRLGQTYFWVYAFPQRTGDHSLKGASPITQSSDPTAQLRLKRFRRPFPASRR
jgi:hypothetical protein